MQLTKAEVLTFPNLFTLVRLLCIPVFVWLLFAKDNRAAAAWLLGGLGATDWIDGYIARRFDQMSEFGKLFDPAVDRLMFVVAIPAIVIDGSAPLIVAALALTREAFVVVAAIALASLGVKPFDVTKEGKAGAFLLMFAFPMFLGAQSTLSYAPILQWLSWIFAIPGIGYSWFSLLFQYLPAARSTLRAR